MSANQVTQEQIAATITTWTHLAKHTDWTAPKVGLALLADRDRLASEVQHLRELRDALVESMGTEGGIPMTDRLAAALEICGVEAKREECPASKSPVVKEGQPTLEAIEAQWSQFLEYLDPQEAGEECAHLGLFAGLLDIAREQRHQLVRLREIEVSEECLRVEQTIMHVPGESRGNCFAAVFAGLLQIPIESIPDFDGPDWRKQVNAFLRPYGLAWLQVGIDKEWLEDSGVSGMWHEVSGTTSRFDGKVRHSCAALDAEVAWDPHPSQSGLAHQNGASIFVALQPWKMARSRLSSSPQPSADVVVVPREEWECIQRIVKAGRNWLTDSKDNAVEDLSFELTQLNWIRNPADALRSSTNHDGEEAPRG
jgi:hypothetical protein